LLKIRVADSCSGNVEELSASLNVFGSPSLYAKHLQVERGLVVEISAAASYSSLDIATHECKYSCHGTIDLTPGNQR
jgi:hypothetical protein